jgi:hypothetical protein
VGPGIFYEHFTLKHCYCTEFQDLLFSDTNVTCSSDGRHVGVIEGRKLESTKVGWPLVASSFGQVSWKFVIWFKSIRSPDRQWYHKPAFTFKMRKVAKKWIFVCVWLFLSCF